MPRHIVLTFLLVSALICGKASAYEKTSSYEAVKVFEWTVLIAPSLNARPRLKQQMMRNLKAQLATIRTSVSPKALRHTTRARIWLEVETKGEDARHIVGQFFTSRTHLRKLGMNPDKYENVQLNALFARDGPNGSVVFHELAHVYHDRKLPHSNLVQRLWENAWLANPGAVDNCGRKTPAYAFRNPNEYFATYSQAFLGKTCAFPYNRATIAKIDPKALAFLQKTWGK